MDTKKPGPGRPDPGNITIIQKIIKYGKINLQSKYNKVLTNLVFSITKY